MRAVTFVFLFLLLGTVQVHASGDAEAAVASAARAYTEGRYNRAAEIYDSLVQAGYESSGLYYNLGNAYYKSGKISRSVLYYEKALKLDPSFEDATFNLQIANGKIRDRIDSVPQPFYKKWWSSLREWLPLRHWALLAVFSFALFFVSAAFFLLSRSRMQRRLFFAASLMLLLLVFMSNLLAFSRLRKMENFPAAIIFEPVVNVKSSPDPASRDIFILHEGSRVEITDRLGDWYEIRIANGSIGWVDQSVLEII